MKTKEQVNGWTVYKTATKDGVSYSITGLSFGVKIFIDWERYEKPDAEEKLLKLLQETAIAI